MGVGSEKWGSDGLVVWTGERQERVWLVVGGMMQ
jgi:hypothetical protein